MKNIYFKFKQIHPWLAALPLEDLTYAGAITWFACPSYPTQAKGI